MRKTKWPTLAELRNQDWRDKHAGDFHAHGCMRCHHRYVDSCEQPREDGLCSLCASNGERADPWWPEGWMPRECCLTQAKKLNPDWKGDKQILESFKLVGRGPWWKCMNVNCGRTHPFDPRKPEDYPMVTIEGWSELNA